MKKDVSPPSCRPGARWLTGAALAATLAACGSAPTPTRFHTLMPPAQAAPVRPTASEAVNWEVLPVQVPAQVDQPQWVLYAADGSLVLLEQERWIAPLVDEIRAAVVERLTQSLGAPVAAKDGRRWLVRIDVRRFDLVAQREARLEATWSLRSDAQPAATVSCAFGAALPPAAPGYASLANAQQRAVAMLADAIGAALKASAGGQGTSC